MGFLWFIVAVVFFILWISSNSSKIKSNEKSYFEGYRRGRKDIADTVHGELKKKTLDVKSIRAVLAEARKEPVEEVYVQEEVTSLVEEVYLRDGPEETPDETAVATQEVYAQETVPTLTKQQTTERNLNVLLYMASFLIVAAAAAFIATSAPPEIRLVGLWFVIIAFYSAGIILHKKVTYLRPAASAFIGTGLALIPFAGIAFSQLGGMSGGAAWFITSLIGIVSYAVAALVLKSQVVGYLTIAFTLSLAASTVATVNGPIVFYFVTLIIASLIFHILARTNAKWVPELFKLPITQTSQLLTPVTLVGSLLMFDTMTIASYQIIFWVATIYYLVLLFTDKLLIYETVSRILFSISAIITVLYVSNYDQIAFQGFLVLLTLAQAAYSIVRVKLADKTSSFTEKTWLVGMIGILAVTFMFWTDPAIAQLGFTIQASSIVLISVAAMYKFRSVYFAIPVLIMSTVMPFIVGRWPGKELVPMEVMTWGFISASLVILGLSVLFAKRSYAVKGFLYASFWVYVFVAVLCSFGQPSTVAFIASSIGVAATVFAASYIYRIWAIEILALVAVIPIVTLIVVESSAPYEWRNVLVVGFTSLIYALLVLGHHVKSQILRRNSAMVALVVMGGGLIFSLTSPAIVQQVVFMLLVLYIVFSLALRTIVKSTILRVLFTVAYAAYPLLLILFGASLGLGWLTVSVLITAVTYWVSSYVEKLSALTAFGNLAFIGFVASAWAWLGLSDQWYLFGVAWATAGVFYVASLLHAIWGLNSERKYIHLIFTWLLLGIATVSYIGFGGSYGYAASGTLIAIAVTLIIEGMVSKRHGLVEAAVYLSTFALQRIVMIAVPEFNMVLYGHWWAVVLFVAAVTFKGKAYTMRLILAMTAITFTTGVMALVDGGVYQLLFLVEHIILLVVGALLRVSWALWWGLTASVLAVLFFLRDSLFLSLLFLGLTLLGIVIWRLIRAQKK